ncbi:MAG: response regulator [Chitinivibrionales bacterium]|nr:response regulator [Chitinivibrionales bacterium]
MTGNIQKILKPENPIVIIDDDRNSLHLMNMTLQAAGFNNIIIFDRSTKALRWTEQNEFDTVVLDIVMPGESGVDTLDTLKKNQPDVPVIMATGVNEMNTAIGCMKKGAHDYIVKPLESERFVSSVANAVKLRRLQRDYLQLTKTILAEDLRNPEVFAPIRTKNPRILSIFRYIEAVAATHYPILITGETGCGKELLARAIHLSSGVAGDFIAVNVAGLDDNTFTDTLFGHVKGAFTGADSDRAGIIVTASNGTLLLDEIGDLSPQSQIKLLRLLQEHEYYPLGCDSPKKSSCRLIAATNKSIDELAASKSFRNDLYYRLRTHHIAIPPLRERKDDLPVLLDYFIEEAAEELKKKKPPYPRELIDLLATYSFPGNVREMQAMVRDAVSMHTSGTLSTESFRKTICPETTAGQTSADSEKETRVTFHTALPTLSQVQDALVQEAFDRSNGNQSLAAQLLGITRQSLSYRLKNMKKQ